MGKNGRSLFRENLSALLNLSLTRSLISISVLRFTFMFPLLRSKSRNVLLPAIIFSSHFIIGNLAAFPLDPEPVNEGINREEIPPRPLLANHQLIQQDQPVPERTDTADVRENPASQAIEEIEEIPPLEEQFNPQSLENLRFLISDPDSLKRIRAIKTMAALKACNVTGMPRQVDRPGELNIPEEAQTLWAINRGDPSPRYLLLNETINSHFLGIQHRHNDGVSTPLTHPAGEHEALNYIIPTMIPSGVVIRIGDGEYQSPERNYTAQELALLHFLIHESFEVYYGDEGATKAIESLEASLRSHPNNNKITVSDINTIFSDLNESHLLPKEDPTLQRSEAFLKQQYLQSQKAIYEAASEMHEYLISSSNANINTGREYLKTPFEHLYQASSDALQLAARAAGVAAATVFGTCAGAAAGILDCH